MQLGKPISYSNAAAQMSKRGDSIKEWAKQNDDLLLKSLAAEVIEVFEAGGGSKCQ